MNADFYVVCDNDGLSVQIQTTKNIKVLRSQRNALKDIWQGTDGTRWVNVGYALLTPFAHANENGIKLFWNIDADDALLKCDVVSAINILKAGENYAIDNGLDLFSLDFFLSQVNHWTFGICFCCTAKNVIDLIANNEALHNILQIDAVFKELKQGDMLNIESFYIENLRFEHIGEYDCSWHNGRLYYHSVKEWYFKRTDGREVIPISNQAIKIDVGLMPISFGYFSTKESIGEILGFRLYIFDLF